MNSGPFAMFHADHRPIRLQHLATRRQEPHVATGDLGEERSLGLERAGTGCLYVVVHETGKSRDEGRSNTNAYTGLMPTNTLGPAALSGASIVIQVCLLTIAYVALVILGRSYSIRNTARGSYSSLVLWLLLTIIVIVMGEDLYAQWSPILGNVTLPSIPRGSAFLAVFILDITFTTVLIFRTGGAKSSPFTSLLFLLPTLAIFLREPADRFLIYSFLVGLIYVTLLRVPTHAAELPSGAPIGFDATPRDDQQAHDWATRWSNVTCLALATLIGYITQPR